MRITCSDLFKRKYKQMRNFSFPCVKSHMTDIISVYWELLHSYITLYWVWIYNLVYIKRGYINDSVLIK